MAPTRAQLLLLCTLLLWTSAAQAQVKLSLRAEAGGGYDSNLYYEGGPVPKVTESSTGEYILETNSGGYIGVLPDATLVVGPLREHYLLLSYQADLRQFIDEDSENETALKQWIMLGYQPPPLLGVRLLLAGGMTQLYFRDQPEGGWLGAVGMVQLRRNLGSDALEMGLSYVANYTTYSEEISANWSLSHTAQLYAAWQPGHGVKVTPHYAFTHSDADPDTLGYTGHTAGLTLGWTLPWAPVTAEVGYEFIALDLQSLVADQQTSTSVLTDRTDLQHRGRARANWKILPWLEAFATWESLWGESNLVDDYTRHQALGGIVLRWDYGAAPRTTLATASAPLDKPDRSISLKFEDPGAKVVAVVGTFNDWDPGRNPMAKKDGAWRLTLAPSAGVHQYMIWVDGEVRPPSTCSRWLDDGFGGKNCVMLIAARE